MSARVGKHCNFTKVLSKNSPILGSRFPATLLAFNQEREREEVLITSETEIISQNLMLSLMPFVELKPGKLVLGLLLLSLSV